MCQYNKGANGRDIFLGGRRRFQGEEESNPLANPRKDWKMKGWIYEVMNQRCPHEAYIFFYSFPFADGLNPSLLIQTAGSFTSRDDNPKSQQKFPPVWVDSHTATSASASSSASSSFCWIKEGWRRGICALPTQRQNVHAAPNNPPHSHINAFIHSNPPQAGKEKNLRAPQTEMEIEGTTK
jgi:hypothetical protein